MLVCDPSKNDIRVKVPQEEQVYTNKKEVVIGS